MRMILLCAAMPALVGFALIAGCSAPPEETVSVSPPPLVEIEVKPLRFDTHAITQVAMMKKQEPVPADHTPKPRKRKRHSHHPAPTQFASNQDKSAANRGDLEP